MASPLWTTGDPGAGAAVPIRISGHPEAELYVWDPNPDEIPEGGYPCMLTLHGGGNKTGSGRASSSAVPLGWGENTGGEFSWVANAENHPIMVCPLTYPMGLSTFTSPGTGRRPMTGHYDGWVAARAVQRALQTIRYRARNNIAPFENVNPDLVDIYATSAGSCWAFLAACLHSASSYAFGETSKTQMVVLSSAAPDINEHLPSQSGTEYMLAGMERAFFGGTKSGGGVDLTKADEVATSGAAWVRASDTGPAAVNLGLHPSGPNEFRRRLSDLPSWVSDMDILTVYALNSNPTEEPPWRRAHDAGQGAQLHRYLESQSLYTGNHRHLANTTITATNGNEADADDALPDEDWAFEWGPNGDPGYQLQWEWIVARYAERGFVANGVGGGGGEPGDFLDPPPSGDALTIETGGFYANEAFDGGVLLEDGDGGGGGQGSPTEDAYLQEDGVGYLIDEQSTLDPEYTFFVLEDVGGGSGTGDVYLTEDELNQLATEDGDLFLIES